MIADKKVRFTSFGPMWPYKYRNKVKYIIFIVSGIMRKVTAKQGFKACLPWNFTSQIFQQQLTSF